MQPPPLLRRGLGLCDSLDARRRILPPPPSTPPKNVALSAIRFPVSFAASPTSCLAWQSAHVFGQCVATINKPRKCSCCHLGTQHGMRAPNGTEIAGFAARIRLGTFKMVSRGSRAQINYHEVS